MKGFDVKKSKQEATTVASLVKMSKYLPSVSGHNTFRCRMNTSTDSNLHSIYPLFLWAVL